MKLWISLNLTNLQELSGLPWSGKTFRKMKKFPGQGKVKEFHFQSGKFRKKNEKKSGKSRGISKFIKKLLANRLLEILFSINCLHK